MTARRTFRVLAATTALGAALSMAPPASAQVLRLDDGADATASLTDIRKVRVGHGDRNVRVRTTFPDLAEESDAWLDVFVDTRRRRRGPEYAIGLPLFSGGDFVLLRMRNWRFVGEPVDCSYGAKFAWDDDYLRLRFDRGCFNDPRRVRVGMRMHDNADPSHPVVDWLVGRRKWTGWVATG